MEWLIGFTDAISMNLDIRAWIEAVIGKIQLSWYRQNTKNFFLGKFGFLKLNSDV